MSRGLTRVGHHWRMGDTRRPNVLLVTLDQFRGDCLSAAGHPVVQTPNLDALAAAGIRLARHYAQCTPCGPGRAALYTGMYQMNHRVVANGTPLDARFDNVALAARRAGYAPVLFGYTDQSIDPRTVDVDDPRLSTYEGVLPGFDVALDLTGEHRAWLDWLAARGVDVSGGIEAVLTTEHRRGAELSLTTFTTDRVLEWLDGQPAGEPWFAHVSYLRPHPPYSAPGEWSRRYDPATLDEIAGPSIEPLPAGERPRFHDTALANPAAAAPTDTGKLAWMRAQYFGNVSHVDHELGRIITALQTSGAWDDTLIVVTADHGEMLGDHGLIEKLGYWEQSYAIVGIVRDPAHPQGHGRVVDEFTENVDLLPTICEAIGVDVPAQCDGVPLAPFLRGEPAPRRWRTAAHWEYDWRSILVQMGPDGWAAGWPADRALERQNLTVLRTATHSYVQFAGGESLCFDLAADPTWRTTTDDPAVILPLAQAMLQWRQQHTDRTLTGMLCEHGGIGRRPTAATAN